MALIKKKKPSGYFIYHVKQERQRTYNIILKHVHETIVAMEKQKYYMFLCLSAHVCVCVGGGGAWGRRPTNSPHTHSAFMCFVRIP
jgi:hypothetical protein